MATLTIPAVDISTQQRNNKLLLNMKIKSWRKLILWSIRESHLDVRWYQWPLVWVVIIKETVKGWIT
jgi:hypothetical protein